MFELAAASEKRPTDFLLTFFYMLYITMVIASIILFNQILDFNLLGMKITLSGGVVPYVFLYPISFIVLKAYGLRCVNQMIASMVVVSLSFVIMSKIVVGLSTNTTEIHKILSNSFQMYIAGFIGMPAGIYSSFLAINLLSKVGLPFNFVSIFIATIVGEIINTIIVYPIGFHNVFSIKTIFSSMIIDAMIFKVIMGAFLACATVIAIKVILNFRTHG